MSAATADRLLRSQRKRGQRGLSTTRAGTLLKQQIPIRTFEEWEETRPGFLEADLVAHCGTDIEGGYLYTLTLTDVATGWTECLPLLYRSRETVLAALQQARQLFPFPMLGIDTGTGGEFASAATDRTLPCVAPVCQLLSAFDETVVERTRREEDSLRVWSSQDPVATVAPFRGLARPEATRTDRGSTGTRPYSVIAPTRAVATGRVPLCCRLLSFCLLPPFQPSPSSFR
jgi:hypothetical protein